MPRPIERSYLFFFSHYKLEMCAEYRIRKARSRWSTTYKQEGQYAGIIWCIKIRFLMLAALDHGS